MFGHRAPKIPDAAAGVPCRGLGGGTRGEPSFALRCVPSVAESVYKRIDRTVYLTERALVVASLLVMAIVVFLDVVHRSFSGEDSKFAMVASKLAAWVGVEVLPGTSSYQSLSDASPWVLLVAFSGLTYFGIRSTKRDTPIAVPVAAVGALVGVLTAYGLVRLLLILVPNGLIWSQPLALMLTLWVGFIGASMCTYQNRHLKVEAAQRFLPEKIRPMVGFVAGLVTTLVCLALMWVSIRYVLFSYGQYEETEHLGGLISGTDLPKYIGFTALPVAFGFMAIRFFVKALAAARGEVEQTVDPIIAAAGLADEAASPPSEVATEALPVHGRQPSSIDTMTSKSKMEADSLSPRPQSKVSTDAHMILGSAASSGSLSKPRVETSKPAPKGDDAPASEASDEGQDPPAAITETRELEREPAGATNETQELSATDDEAADDEADQEGSR